MYVCLMSVSLPFSPLTVSNHGHMHEKKENRSEEKGTSLEGRRRRATELLSVVGSKKKKMSAMNCKFCHFPLSPADINSICRDSSRFLGEKLQFHTMIHNNYHFYRKICSILINYSSRNKILLLIALNGTLQRFRRKFRFIAVWPTQQTIDRDPTFVSARAKLIPAEEHSTFCPGLAATKEGKKEEEKCFLSLLLFRFQLLNALIRIDQTAECNSGGGECLGQQSLLLSFSAGPQD